jgi:hypothetical protein
MGQGGRKMITASIGTAFYIGGVGIIGALISLVVKAMGNPALATLIDTVALIAILFAAGSVFMEFFDYLRHIGYEYNVL